MIDSFDKKYSDFCQSMTSELLKIKTDIDNFDLWNKDNSKDIFKNHIMTVLNLLKKIDKTASIELNNQLSNNYNLLLSRLTNITSNNNYDPHFKLYFTYIYLDDFMFIFYPF
jgi:hypothetical protein